MATTPTDAVALLRAAVTELDRRAAALAAHGARVWEPNPDAPALVVVIDEYAELSDQARELADSLARRGRAVAITLLAATQRPTQRAMGAGAVRSQMDLRICLRVRERRDTDLILGQGMLAAGWHPHTLDAPGKFLLSAPEHTTPRRGRAYHLDDNQVSATATRNAHRRPSPPDDSTDQVYTAAPESDQATTSESNTNRRDEDPETVLWRELRNAPEYGITVSDLMNATGMGRTWVYDRLHEHTQAGRATQTYRGRWRATTGHDG